MLPRIHCPVVARWGFGISHHRQRSTMLHLRHVRAIGYFGVLTAWGCVRGKDRFGSCVTSIAGPNGAAQLYER
jgi:hypothetical protein